MAGVRQGTVYVDVQADFTAFDKQMHAAGQRAQATLNKAMQGQQQAQYRTVNKAQYQQEQAVKRAAVNQAQAQQKAIQQTSAAQVKATQANTAAGVKAASTVGNAQVKASQTASKQMTANVAKGANTGASKMVGAYTQAGATAGTQMSQGIIRGQQKAQKQTQLGWAQVFRRVAMYSVAWVGVQGAVRFFKDAANEAGRFQDEASKAVKVFGSEGQAELLRWSKEAARAFGLSRTEALEAAGQFGVMALAVGKSKEGALEWGQNLTKLSADMASFDGGPVSEAVTAISSALRGESEPIKRYGVLVDDWTLKNRALQMGLVETTTGVLPPAIRAQAAYMEIVDQQRIKMDDYSDTADNYVNTQRTFTATMKDFKKAVGDALLPMLTKLMQVFLPLVEAMARMSPGQLQWTTAILAGVAALALLTKAVIFMNTGLTATAGLWALITRNAGAAAIAQGAATAAGGGGAAVGTAAGAARFSTSAAAAGSSSAVPAAAEALGARAIVGRVATAATGAAAGAVVAGAMVPANPPTWLTEQNPREIAQQWTRALQEVTTATGQARIATELFGAEQIPTFGKKATEAISLMADSDLAKLKDALWRTENAGAATFQQLGGFVQMFTDMAAANGVNVLGIDAVTFAMQSQEKQAENLTSAWETLMDPFLGEQDAYNNFEAGLAGIDEQMKLLTDGTPETAEELRAMSTAVTGATGDFGDLATAMIANGKGADAVNAAKARIVADLTKMAETAEDPLRQQIINTIAKLNEFDAVKAVADANVEGNAEEKIRGIANSMADLFAQAHTAPPEFIKSVAQGRGLPGMNAMGGRIGLPIKDAMYQVGTGGGRVSDWTAVVGEGDAPEYVIPTDRKYRTRAIALMTQASKEIGVTGLARGGAIGGGFAPYLDVYSDADYAAGSAVGLGVADWFLQMARASGKGQQAAAYAQAQIGKPYVWAQSGPDSFDCSGLTMASWRAAGVSIPRVSHAQIAAARAMNMAEAIGSAGALFYTQSAGSPSGGHIALSNGDGSLTNARGIATGVQRTGPFGGRQGMPVYDSGGMSVGPGVFRAYKDEIHLPLDDEKTIQALATAMSKAGGRNITVNAQTNASPRAIADEIAWATR